MKVYRFFNISSFPTDILIYVTGPAKSICLIFLKDSAILSFVMFFRTFTYEANVAVCQNKCSAMLPCLCFYDTLFLDKI